MQKLITLLRERAKNQLIQFEKLIGWTWRSRRKDHKSGLWFTKIITRSKVVEKSVRNLEDRF